MKKHLFILRHINIAVMVLSLGVVGSFLPGSEVNAQTDDGYTAIQPYDNARTKTWSIYGSAGASCSHGKRDLTDKYMSSKYLSPELSLGVKFNINPTVRLGLNVGYTKTKWQNTDIDSTTTTTENYTVGSYTNATLTTKSAVIDNRYDQHLLFTDLNVDINPLVLFGCRASAFNLWLGTGIGYYHGWWCHNKTTAYDKDALVSDESVYSESYIEKETTSDGIDNLYVPFRLSLEYDITPQWTIGLKGEYKLIPMNVSLTQKGILSAGVTLAYNFNKVQTPKQQRQALKYQSEIAVLNNDVNTLRAQNASLAYRTKQLQDSLAHDNDTIAASKRITPPVSIVFFGAHKFKVEKGQINNLNVIKKLLSDYPYYNILVKGFASEDEGDDNYNKAIAARRAQAVANILIKDYKIPGERVKTQGYGVADNNLYTAVELHRTAMIYFLEQSVLDLKPTPKPQSNN